MHWERIVWTVLRTTNTVAVTLSSKKRKIFVRLEKQPSRGVLRKRCSENMQQICRRTPMLKRDFNKVDMQFC